MTNLRCEEILSWFSGKALENAGKALDMLLESEKQGTWVKGASRKVRAALTKANVAQKTAKVAWERYEGVSGRFRSDTTETNGAPTYDQLKTERDAWFKIHMAMHYGSRVYDIPVAVATLRDMKIGYTADCVIEKAERFANDMLPATRLMSLLDSRRPARTVVFKTLSPTVLKTFSSLGMEGMNLATIREPKIEWKWVERTDAKGQLYQVMAGVVVWPKGTQHGCSKFSTGSKAGNRQCHACGHAIKNPYNYLPILIDSAAGVPHSLWIGKDCAKNLFDADVEGDAEYVEK